MPLCRIADLIVDMPYQYAYTAALTAGFHLPDGETSAPDLCLRAEEAAKEDSAVRPGAREATAFLRDLAENLPDFDGFILHACTVAKDGSAYAFSAPSGTGKTTHARLWLDAFPGAFILNGDKPAVRRIDGVFRAYGTPWCGKENIRVNASCPLAGLFFLERAAQNRAERLSTAAALPLLLGQIAMPADPSRAERVWTLLDAFLRVVPVFRMHCNMEEEAAHVAFAAAAGE